MFRGSGSSIYYPYRHASYTPRSTPEPGYSRGGYSYGPTSNRGGYSNYYGGRLYQNSRGGYTRPSYGAYDTDDASGYSDSDSGDDRRYEPRYGYGRATGGYGRGYTQGRGGYGGGAYGRGLGRGSVRTRGGPSRARNYRDYSSGDESESGSDDGYTVGARYRGAINRPNGSGRDRFSLTGLYRDPGRNGRRNGGRDSYRIAGTYNGMDYYTGRPFSITGEYDDRGRLSFRGGYHDSDRDSDSSPTGFDLAGIFGRRRR